MRRILLTLLVGGALVALVPATALAAHHHGKAHHRARHHTRRHSRVRFERFGATSTSSSQSSNQSGQGNEQNAGTVDTFQNGALTITLNDGSTVTGKVTPDTEIECSAEGTSSNMQRDDQGRDHGDQGDDNGNDNGDDNDNESGEQSQNAQSCSSADLQPGTVVREAELKVTGSGANWDKVELVTSQGSTGSGSGSGDDDGADS